MHIRHIYISPAHNYVGHHGKAPGTHSDLEVDQVECVAGKGLRGDRYFNHKPDYKGQITFFDWDHLVRMWDELKVPPQLRDAAATRRNVLVEGIDLNSLIGCEFTLQGIRFMGTEECRPCHWMNRAIHPEAEPWMRGRGGLRARILDDGILRRDGSKPLDQPD